MLFATNCVWARTSRGCGLIIPVFRFNICAFGPGAAAVVTRTVDPPALPDVVLERIPKDVGRVSCTLPFLANGGSGTGTSPRFTLHHGFGNWGSERLWPQSCAKLEPGICARTADFRDLGFISRDPEYGPEYTPRSRSAPGLTGGCVSATISHGCRIFAHWAKFVRGSNFYLSRKYIISHVSPGPPQWPSSLANQFNTTVWDEKQHESSIHTNPTVFISCVCLFLNSKCGLPIGRESSQRNRRNQCVV